ncbi:MAG: phosphoadenylyl-sulfate reductase [Halobacteria archaeon]|nr:phosphoadenylyl-sulfate reductase [Halobacteria archaeon]
MSHGNVESQKVEKFKDDFESTDALRRLERGFDEFGEVVVASSFGLEDVAILDMTYDELGLRPPVIFLDTLHHFDETLELVEEFDDEYDLNLEVYKPEGVETREEFEEKYGERLWETDVERYHELTKLRQIDRALEGRDAWVTGIRREQAETREEADAIEWDDGHGLVKINPLVDWSRGDVVEYVDENDVPYNPLHDEGYLSIGDEPLTEPVEGEEGERSGRWSGSDKTECGLHTEN